MRQTTVASLACIYAGAVWGLFWLPLRAVEDANIDPAWATAVYFLLSALLLLPIALWRWRPVLAGGRDLQITALVAGAAMAFYSIGIIYTEVVRAMLLFYLTPIWSTLLARWVLGQPISQGRWIAMTMAVAGMLVLFGLGFQFPWPRNLGDWMALISGVFWAIAMVRLHSDSQNASLDMTLSYFWWCLVVSAIAAVFLAPAGRPTLGEVVDLIPWLAPVMALLVIPGAFAAVWGPKFLNPGVAGLLFMSEIIVGAISAAIWAGEPFGTREIIGITLIAGASLVEPIQALRTSTA